MSTRRRRLLPVLIAAVALIAAACGTRLPDSAFTQAQGGTGNGSNSATGAGGNGSGPNGVGNAGAAPSGAAGGGTGGAGSSSSGRGRAATGKGPSGSKPLPGGAGNFASDVGVTPNEIQVGIVNSMTNAFDPHAFVGMYYGAVAYFDTLDQHGGVHGRLVHVNFCNDQGQGSNNVSCVQSLINNDHVFAFVAGAELAYNGASYVEKAGVPDVAGQPIDTAYDQYSDLFSFYGSQYPRNNSEPGVNGYDYGGTEVYRYFKLRFPNVPFKAAVVYYNQAASQRFAQNTANGLKAEGYSVDMEEINFALPDYNSAVLTMKQKGVRYVYDVLDEGGNESLCRAMDQNSFYVQAKVTTDENMVDSTGSDFSASPHCRNSIYAFTYSDNYEDTNIAAVAAVRAGLHRYGFDSRSALSEWELDGWASAQWLTDGIRSCGADLTRKCLLSWLNHLPASGYNGDGLLDPGGRNYIRWTGPPPKTVHNCVGIARWQDSADGGAGGWVTQPLVGNDHEDGFSCFEVYNIPYPAT
jgi:branched-chain amino acid transport system substrate-binding protein